MSTRYVHEAIVVSLLALLGAGCGSSATEALASSTARNRAAPAAHRTTRAQATAGRELGAEASHPCATSAVYYSFDSSDLDPAARSTLERNAECLKRSNREAAIVGMTDPRGTEEYNIALGDRRARTAARYMTTLGVDEARLRTVTLGEEAAEGTDELTWARDRRADVSSQ